MRDASLSRAASHRSAAQRIMQPISTALRPATTFKPASPVSFPEQPASIHSAHHTCPVFRLPRHNIRSAMYMNLSETSHDSRSQHRSSTTTMNSDKRKQRPPSQMSDSGEDTIEKSGDIPSSVRGAPANMKYAIRKKQNKEVCYAIACTRTNGHAHTVHLTEARESRRRVAAE